MKGYQSLNGDKERLYSAHVTKLNRSMKADARVYVLCDLHFYRLDSSNQMKKKPPVNLGEITGMSISPGSDQAIVIHCVVCTQTRTYTYIHSYKHTNLNTHTHTHAHVHRYIHDIHIATMLYSGLLSPFPPLHVQPEVGDIVFYIEKGRPAAELAAALWYTYWRKYKQSLPLNITTKIRYSRPGVKDGLLQCDSGASPARTQSFKKEGGNRVSVMWPEEKDKK